MSCLVSCASWPRLREGRLGRVRGGRVRPLRGVAEGVAVGVAGWEPLELPTLST